MKHEDIALLMKGAAPAFRDFVVAAVEPLQTRIAELERQLAAIPAPANGKDGRDGADGKPGAAGVPGEKGEPGTAGRDGKDGASGKDGRGVADMLTDANGHMIVTYTDGSTKDVGRIVGADGKDGRDGADGKPGERGEKGDPGSDGANGKDGVAGRDGKDGERGEKGEKGEPGIDGVDGAPGAKGDPGADGKDGRDGIDGQNGKDGAAGRDGTNGKDGAPGPRGEKGETGEKGDPGLAGRDGLNGEKGEKGERGENGADGKDGIGLADAMIDRDGSLILTMTDGRHKQLGIVIGKDGAPGKDGANGADGKDGADGLGFDDLAVEYDGERDFAVKFVRGDKVKEFPFVLPIVLDKGVWQERGPDGSGYKKGDGVTWSGQFYIARKDTFAKPDDFDAWRLSVKRGRDAKEPVALK